MGVSLRFRFVLLLGNYVTEEQLMEVAEYSEVLNIPNDFLELDFPENSTNIIPYPERIEKDEWYDAYIHLKGNMYNINFSNRSLLSLFHVNWFPCVSMYS